MICFAFAVPHEAEDLLESIEGAESFTIGITRFTVGKLGHRNVVVAIIGMGGQNAHDSIRRVFQYFRVKCIVLAGYGGALTPQLKKGQVIISTNFTNSEILSHVRLLSGFDFAKVCTAEEVVATPERKAQYLQATDCQVVDMESVVVAELMHERELPLVVIRGISDEAQEILPTGALAAAWDMETNRSTPWRLVKYFAGNPSQIKPFQDFIGALPEVRKNMTNFVLTLTEELPKNW
ncbi:MAG: hypothetical protein ACAI35_21105 [Candidatus Methylacidiphilales bacterium]|nr:hypothetical protein [Candidatus Methylacidiphilales bacterium]